MAKVLPKIGDVIFSLHFPSKKYEVTSLGDESYAGIHLTNLADNHPDTLGYSAWYSDAGQWVVLEKPLPDKRQVGGDHYTKHTLQPWDIIDAYGFDFYEGNALKYLLRY